MADAAERQVAARARTWRARAGRATAAGRRALVWLAGAGLAIALLVLAVRSGGGGAGLATTASCGELTRVRSVGAVGVPGPEEAVNLLALPHRASVRLAAAPVAPTPPGASSGAGAPGAPSASGPDQVEGLVDECDTGWRAGPGVGAPVTFLVTPVREDAYIQRFVLWQDPGAPQAAWVKDFEVLASPSPAGDDFSPVTLDRPARLLPTREQQWFQAVQPAPEAAGAAGAAGAPPEGLDPRSRGRVGQPFPAAVQARRLLVRVLSTQGEGAGVALGELAAFGPDLEVAIDDAPCADPTGRPSGGCFAFAPREVRALAGRPMSVLFLNRSRASHDLVSAGQDRNFEVRLEPGQAASGLFAAAGRPGVYEFVCRVPGHDRDGLLGRITVR
jgi:plastocyanin